MTRSRTIGIAALAVLALAALLIWVFRPIGTPIPAAAQPTRTAIVPSVVPTATAQPTVILPTVVKAAAASTAVPASPTPAPTFTPLPTAATTATSVIQGVKFADGTAVSAPELSKRIGGDPRGWSARCTDGRPASQCSVWGFFAKLADGTTVPSFIPNTIPDATVTYWGGFVPLGKDFKVQANDLGDPSLNSTSLKGCWASFTDEANVNDTTFSVQCPAPVRVLSRAVTGSIDGLAVHFPSR